MPPEFLAEAEFFRALPPERRRGLRRLLREKRFERQQALFVEGAEAEFLWLIRQGEVRLYKSSDDGSITTLDPVSMPAAATCGGRAESVTRAQAPAKA